MVNHGSAERIGKRNVEIETQGVGEKRQEPREHNSNENLYKN